MSTGEAAAAPVARICSDGRGLLSEGPQWDADRGELMWVAILAGQLHTATVGDAGPPASGGGRAPHRRSGGNQPPEDR